MRPAPLAAARRHGGTPSISISSEKLRKVRISTIRPRTLTFSSVGATATVLIRSAATRISRPRRSTPPKVSRSAREPARPSPERRQTTTARASDHTRPITRTTTPTTSKPSAILSIVSVNVTFRSPGLPSAPLATNLASTAPERGLGRSTSPHPQDQLAELRWLLEAGRVAGVRKPDQLLVRGPERRDVVLGEVAPGVDVVPAVCKVRRYRKIGHVPAQIQVEDALIRRCRAPVEAEQHAQPVEMAVLRDVQRRRRRMLPVRVAGVVVELLGSTADRVILQSCAEPAVRRRSVADEPCDGPRLRCLFRAGSSPLPAHPIVLRDGDHGADPDEAGKQVGATLSGEDAQHGSPGMSDEVERLSGEHHMQSLGEVYGIIHIPLGAQRGPAGEQTVGLAGATLIPVDNDEGVFQRAVERADPADLRSARAAGEEQQDRPVLPVPAEHQPLLHTAQPDPLQSRNTAGDTTAELVDDRRSGAAQHG